MTARQRAYRPWTDAEEVRLRELVESHLQTPEIARKMGRDKTSIRNKMGALGLTYSPATHSAVDEWQERKLRAEAEVERRAEVYEWLRPVELPAPAKSKAKPPAPTAFTIIAGDFHFGMHDARAVDVLLQVIEAVKPKRLILNGDTVDLLAVSKYPKDHRRGKSWELRDEVAAFHSFLHSVQSINPAMEILETEANHSGDGTAGRWWRYLNDRCPELLGHAEAEERLSYPNWFFPKWSTIRLVDSVMVANDLLVLHGDMVRSEAAYTAKASREKWMNSIMVNHTHRMGLAPKTIAAIHGRPPSYVRAYENGCLCKLEVPYGVALNWQQGFAIVNESPDLFGVEQVFIDNGRANVATLGKTVTA